MKFKRGYIVVAAAIIIPGGLIVLGLWKSYELLKKKDENEPTTTNP